jgi:polysaccharide biosynthesis/export protein
MVKGIKIRQLFCSVRIFSSLALLVSMSFFTSCLTQHNLEYMQDRDKTVKSFDLGEVQEYKLKPDDELFIQISSQDEAAANVFASPGGSQNSMGPYGASIMAYIVNKQGLLEFPVIGSILVAGKTLPEVGQMIKDSLSRILNQPIITVKLVNRFITVLGEVRSPGHFNFMQQKLNIYEAIGLAGDITEFGNKKEVIITRSENGKTLRINLDLNNSEILSSNYYYVMPNDVIYVKPLRKKFWGMKEFPAALIMSTLTTAILIYTVFK